MMAAGLAAAHGETMSAQLLVTIAGGVAVILLAWIGRLIVRAIHALYDTTRSVQTLGEKFDAFTPVVDGRLGRLEKMVARIWSHIFPGEDPPA